MKNHFNKTGIAWVPVVLLSLTIAVLYHLDIKTVKESSELLTILNILFCSSLSFFMAYLAARSYLITGDPILVYMGSCMLIWGFTTAFVGPLSHNPNIALTMQSAGVCVAGSFCLISALFALINTKRKKIYLQPSDELLATYYVGSVIFIIILELSARHNLLPPFFIPGQGSTLLLQLTLGAAILQFAVSAVIFGISYIKTKSIFLYWYFLGFILLALGLLAVSLTAPGTPLNWTGRTALFIAGPYLLIAMIIIKRETVGWYISIKKSLSQAEEEKKATVDFLRLINENTGTRELIKASVAFFKERSGCEAVGIRVKEGADYPYYEALGFPDEFLLLENNLCSLDSSGKPSLDCMCGNVLCGRIDPSKSFYTSEGSFWTNSTTELLANCSEGERQIFTRKRCYIEGYESVALIMFRSDSNRLGLLQLNDRRNNMFTRETIALWERLTGYLAVALAKSKVEEALQKSEERFRAIAFNTPDHILVQEQDLRYSLVINPQLGLKEQEMIGKTDYDLLSKEDADNLTKIKKQVLDTGDPVNLTVPLLSLKGEQQFFEGAYVPRLNKKGHPDGIIGYFKDITERKKMEDRLVEQQKEQQTILDSVPALIFYKDKENRFLRVNEAFAEIMQRPKKELEGKSLFDFYPKEQAEAFWADDKEVIASGSPKFNITEPMKVKDDIRWVQTDKIPYRNARGDTIGVIGFSVDITERKKAEKIIQSSLDRFALLAQTASELLQSQEPQKLINSLCQKIMEHLDCHVFFNFLAGEQDGKLHLNTYSGITDEEARRIEWLDKKAATVCSCVANSGVRIVAEQIPSIQDPKTELVRSYGIKAYACHPILGTNGEVIGTLSFGTRSRENFSNEDLSLMQAITDQVAMAMIRMRDEQRLQENRLEAARVEAQKEIDRAKRLSDIGMLAATVAHELRNPLAAINMAIANIKRKVQNPAVNTHLQNIGKMVIESDQIISNLLFYSRLRPPNYERVSINDIINECIESSMHRFEPSKKALLKKEIAMTKDIHIEADPLQIKETVSNILNNAYDAVSKDKGKIEISTENNGNSVDIYISDNGAGIADENLQKVFDPFFTTKAKGTGLGLAVCHHIVNLHKGTIQIESKLDEGTKIHIVLPVAHNSVYLIKRD